MLRPKKGTETSQGLNLILIFITLYYRKYVFFHFLILVSLLNIKRRNDTQIEMPAWIPIPGRWRRQRHFFKFYHDCISMDNKENKFTAIPLNKQLTFQYKFRKKGPANSTCRQIQILQHKYESFMSIQQESFNNFTLILKPNQLRYPVQVIKLHILIKQPSVI